MLVLRRQPLNFPHDDPDANWSVFADGTRIGVIVEQRGRSDKPKDWRWAMHLHAGGFTNGLEPTGGSAPTREAAMHEFRAVWDVIRPAIGDEGWALHVAHMAWSEAQTARWRRQRAGTEQGGYG
jgi:hypothetical protein